MRVLFMHEPFLIGVAASLLAALLYAGLTKLLPSVRHLWAGIRPFSVGDTVSWNKGDYLIIERSGTMFRYRYKLLDASAVNAFLLPALASNPQLAGESAALFWYTGKNGRCYLKKTGHPSMKLELKPSVRR